MSNETAPISLEKSDPHPAETNALLGEIPFRTPVVDESDEELNPGISTDLQWLAVTEAARRGILSDTEVRRTASKFTSEPLDEKLPETAVEEIAKVDVRTARMARRMGSTLMKTLQYQAVPDMAISPDIANAPYLIRKEDQVSRLSMAEQKNEKLERIRKRVSARQGISEGERELIARRYRFARDVKMLGLMAELYDQPIENPVAENGVVSLELASGTKLVMDARTFEAVPDLLDPRKWQSRIQLKDRVYAVTVDGKQYIMKERKTSRHVDVFPGHHKDGLTSKQEFETAREFVEQGAVTQGDVQLSWEKPLGYVEFPDGYQFCMFESEPELNVQAPRLELVNGILSSPEEYREEYEQIARRAKEIYHDSPNLVRSYHYESVPSRLLSRITRRKQPKPDELTFEEFAEAKARNLIEEAEDLLHQTALELDYVNKDLDGFGYRVHAGTRISLEIIGFDFEYYQKNPERAAQIKQKIKRSKENGKDAAATVVGTTSDRGIKLAAIYAMLE